MQGKVGAVLAPLGFGLLAIALFGAGGANAVTDTASPSLTLPAAATTNATSSRGATVFFIAVAADDIQPTSLVCAPASGAQFPVGTTTVTCTAMDAASHSISASFAITVLGASDQLALLRAAVIALHLDPSIQQGLLDKLDAAKGSILAGQSTIACNQLNAFANQVKAQTKKAIADGTNLLNGQYEIEAALDCVQSKAAPVVLGPSADVTTNTAPGSATATVRYTGPACNPSSPAALALGTTHITCQATNPNGTTNQSFSVTVLDREAPVLSVPSDITATAPAGSSTAVVTFTATATDNVGVRSTVCAPASGTAFAHGVTTVSCTATDTSGNTATGSFKVTVNFAISGRVTSTAGGAGIAGVSVELSGPGGAPGLGLSATTDATGAYSIVVPPGSYAVLFNGAFTLPYSRQWWNHQPDDPDTLVLAGSVGGIDASLSPGVFVHGRVTDAATNQGLPHVFAAAFDASAPCCRFVSGRGTDDGGNYTFVVPAGSAIKIHFTTDTSRRYMGEWWDDKPNFDLATALTVNAETFHKDAALAPAVLISGLVTDDQTGAGIGGIAVNITDSTKACCPFNTLAFGRTAADGSYSVLVPIGTPVKINFFPFGAGSDPRYIGEWLDDKPNWDQASINTFTSDTSGVNAALTHGFYIRGHITRRDGTPIAGLHANANDGLAQCCRFITGAQSDRNGDYAILVRPGTYKVLFFSRVPFLAADGVTYIDQVWNGAPNFEQGTPVIVNSDVDGINAVMTPAVTLSGRVTNADGSAGVPGFQVNAIDATVRCCQFVGGAQTDQNGDYSIALPPGLTVKVDFGVFSGPPPGTRYVPQWWNNKSSFEAADSILAAADVPNINARLANGFLITGHVSERGSGAALEGMHVQVFDSAVPCCPFRQIAQTESNATGDYAVVLGAGSYKVQFTEFPPAVRPHLSQWWQDKPFDQGADVLVVAGDRTGIDATLPVGVFISGSVTAAGGTVPVVGLNVSAQAASQPCCQFVGGTQTDAAGNYRFPVPAGSAVKVEFGVFSGPPPGTRYVGQWWDNKPDFGSANTINALTDVSGINADLTSGFVLSGHVTDSSGTIPLGTVGVNANDATQQCCQFIVGTQTDAAGNYRLIVPAGRVIRVFFSTNPAGGVRYLPEWWNDKPFFDQATDIAMTADRPGVDARLASGVLVHGRVTDSTGTIPVVGLNVSAQDATQFCCHFVGGSRTDLDGQYTMIVPAGAQLKIEFGVFNPPAPSTHLAGQWWSNRPTFESANVISANTDVLDINARLAQSFTLSGRVTEFGTGLPLAGIHVQPSDASAVCCPLPSVGFGAQTDMFGNYSLALPAGHYKLSFFQFPFGEYPHFPAMWHDKRFDFEGDVVDLAGDVGGIDQSLRIAVFITGQVTDETDGQPIAGLQVTAQDAAFACCRFVDGAQTDATGFYRFIAPLGSSVKVQFGGGPPTAIHYVGEWWDNQPTFETATAILADANKTANAQLARFTGPTISGRVTDSARPGVGVEGISVTAQPAFGCCFYGATTDADGRYSINVTPGTYRVSFFSAFGSDLLEQWWNDKPGFSAADLLTVPSTTVDLTSINAALIHGIPVRGTVTSALDGIAVGQVGVVATLDDPVIPCCVNYRAQTGPDGTYTMYVRAGHYRINFQAPNATDFVSEYWDGQPDFGAATVLNVAGPTEHIDASLDRGFRVSGRVTDANGGAGVAGVFVGVNDVVCCRSAGFGFTGPDGTYSATVRSGTYTVAFNPPFGSDFVLQFWNNKLKIGAADHLLVDAAKPNIDAVLTHGIQVTGRITDAADSTIALPGSSINALTAGDFKFVAFASADAGGNYTLFLPPGDYILWFNGPVGSDYGFEYWNDKADQASADVVHVAGPLSDVNVGLSRFVRISGRVTDDGGHPIAGLFVNVDRPTLPFTFVNGGSTDADGRYSILARAGTYKVFFPIIGPYASEWWDDKPTFETATTIDATASIGGIDAALTPIDSTPPGSSGPPSDGTPPAGSGAAVADDRAIARGLTAEFFIQTLT